MGGVISFGSAAEVRLETLLHPFGPCAGWNSSFLSKYVWLACGSSFFFGPQGKGEGGHWITVAIGGITSWGRVCIFSRISA